jgi:hypothetical protein
VVAGVEGKPAGAERVMEWAERGAGGEHRAPEPQEVAAAARRLTARRQRPDAAEPDTEGTELMPTEQDVINALEPTPVREVSVDLLEFDKHCQSGQIRDIQPDLYEFYFKKLKSSPAPVSLIRGVAVNTGSM